MRHFFAASLLAVGGLSFAAMAQSQSLAEVAKKEKARRAEIAETSKDKPVVVVDEHALRTTQASTFTAVEVTGGATRSTDPVELGRPAPENPNRAKPVAPAKKDVQVRRPPPGVANTEMGKGWSTNHDNTSHMREAPPGTVPLQATHPYVRTDEHGRPIR